MWDDVVPDELRKDQPEGVKIPHRRIEKVQDLRELATVEATEKFYHANRRYIFEY